MRVLLAVVRLWVASLLVACTSPPIPQPVAPMGAAPGLCATAPKHIYYGSCGDKLAAGPSSCVVCDGARGCSPFAGVYCVGAASCDDVACKP